MSQSTFFGLWPGRSLDTTDVRYSKEPTSGVGCCCVNLGYKGQMANNILLIVVEGSGPSLPQVEKSILQNAELEARGTCTCTDHGQQVIYTSLLCSVTVVAMCIIYNYSHKGWGVVHLALVLYIAPCNYSLL